MEQNGNGNWMFDETGIPDTFVRQFEYGHQHDEDDNRLGGKDKACSEPDIMHRNGKRDQKSAQENEFVRPVKRKKTNRHGHRKEKNQVKVEHNRHQGGGNKANAQAI